MISQILEMDKKIRERAKEIYGFVSEKELGISVSNLWGHDYYYIDKNTINFCDSDGYETETTRCPIRYFGDNWKELVLEDNKVIEDKIIEIQNKIYNNNIESDKREYLRLKKLFEGDE